MRPVDLTEVKAKIDIEYKIIDKNEIIDYYEELNFNLKNTFKEKVKRDEIGIFAYFKNHIVGYVWISFSKKTELLSINPIIELQQNQAYIYYCHTFEHYRGKNIYPYLLFIASKYAFTRKNMKKILIDTSPDNIASQHGIKKIGFKERYIVSILRLFGYIVSKKRSSNVEQFSTPG